jgi:hypothetical protein
LLHLYKLHNGKSPEEGILKAIIEEVAAYLQKKYKHYTFSQLKLACLRGVRGEYGTWYHLNYESVLKWLKSFHAEKMTADKKLIEARKDEEKRISDEEKEYWQAEFIKGLMEAFKAHKDGKPFEDRGNAYYDHLDKEGLVNLTLEQKKAIFEEAKEEWINTKETLAKTSSDTSERRRLRGMIEQVGKHQDAIKVIAKRKALEVVFDGMDKIELG